MNEVLSDLPVQKDNKKKGLYPKSKNKIQNKLNIILKKTAY